MTDEEASAVTANDRKFVQVSPKPVGLAEILSLTRVDATGAPRHDPLGRA